MAVYTALDDDVLGAWLAAHDVGSLEHWTGISAGIENSNFFVTTRTATGTHRFVLTLFERLHDDELDFCLGLMQHLAARAIPCPAPIADRSGMLSSPLAGRPAALVTRLPGEAQMRPSTEHCAAIGAVLARLHLAAHDLALSQPNPRGIDWWLETATRVRPFVDDAQRALLDDEIEVQRMRWPALTDDLPRGPIHADLFRDNALFVNGEEGVPELGGIIDFYFAGCDAWLFDLAICANDWCIDPADGRFDERRLRALVSAYQAVRAISADECDAWPVVLRAAALRFWLSRLDDLHRPRPAQLLTPHDPTHFERVLRARREDTAAGVDLRAMLERALVH